MLFWRWCLERERSGEEGCVPEITERRIISMYTLESRFACRIYRCVYLQVQVQVQWFSHTFAVLVVYTTKWKLDEFNHVITIIAQSTGSKKSIPDRTRYSTRSVNTPHHSLSTLVPSNSSLAQQASFALVVRYNVRRTIQQADSYK